MGGRHAEHETVERPLVDAPVLPVPRTPRTGPATGSRGPATGSRGPATGSRGPATGSRRAPGRRRHWVPIALAIWIASFLAVPAAVLVHEAVTGDDTPVVEAGETHDESGTGSAPAAGDAGQPAADPAAPGAHATSAGSGHQDDPAVAGAVDPGDPAAEVVQGQVVVPGTAVTGGTPAAASSAGTAVVPVGGGGNVAAASTSSKPTSSKPTSDSPAPVSSSPAPEPVVEEPPAEAANPGLAAQDAVTP
ncbi:hypothetical protein [Klenkia soli]|uniref:hypothetical protein n=1 Tax=Klenkia soli TaxID=1052260 RepID=UPI000B878057|nr:hypothetical protein [Klenkia soli]